MGRTGPRDHRAEVGRHAHRGRHQGLCKENIAGFKVPKSVEFRDEPLPLSGALKVLKKELRKPYWEGKERSVG